ncbi:hypothetical protein EYF80_023050 [Liparis tanakae]|uniref:Uncharacterized protein n=1 Tax=Liparis tanakae TaxID=230148 RepID=A0A4Z2HLT1_9TELE|nr:hypothetical protein EYF80_023050 [Liparis tanakae]
MVGKVLVRGVRGLLALRQPVTQPVLVGQEEPHLPAPALGNACTRPLGSVFTSPRAALQKNNKARLSPWLRARYSSSLSCGTVVLPGADSFLSHSASTSLEHRPTSW